MLAKRLFYHEKCLGRNQTVTAESDMSLLMSLQSSVAQSVHRGELRRL